MPWKTMQAAKTGDPSAKSFHLQPHTLFRAPSINGSDDACAYLSEGEVFSVFGSLHVRNISRLPTGTYAPLLRRAFTTLPADWMKPPYHKSFSPKKSESRERLSQKKRHLLYKSGKLGKTRQFIPFFSV